MINPAIRETDEGAILTVKVVPGSSRTTIGGMLNNMLKIKISSPPEKGKANHCLIEFLAEKLGVKKSNISIISGQSSPVKSIKIQGISAETLSAKLGLKESGL